MWIKLSAFYHIFKIFFWYTIESKQLTLLKSAFILCYYYFVVQLRVNKDLAVGMTHVTVSSDVMRLVLKHRRRTKLVWNYFACSKIQMIHCSCFNVCRVLHLVTILIRCPTFHIETANLNQYQFPSMLNKTWQFLNSDRYLRHTHFAFGVHHIRIYNFF